MYTSEIYNKLDDVHDDDEADEEMKAFITHFANDGQRQRRSTGEGEGDRERERDAMSKGRQGQGKRGAQHSRHCVLL